MQIRIKKAVLEHGHVQWLRGQIAILPDEIGQQFVDAGDAVELLEAERLTLSGHQHAVVPRAVTKPTTKPKKKAR